MNTVASPGCVVFLIDESAAMGVVAGDVVASGRRAEKSNAERVATALNALLKQLTSGPDFDLAVIGYQADAADQVNVNCRWGGPLAGRDFVSTHELSASPLRVESRTRKVPAPGGIGLAHEEPFDFPIWYAPALGAKAPQIAAFRYCRELLAKWMTDCGPEPGTPLLIHITAGASGDGNPQKAVEELMQLSTPGGTPLLFQVHLAPSAEAMTSLYPSTHVYLTLGSARDLFRRASPLPSPLVEILKQANVSVNPGARGMIYNAKIADLIRLLSLVASHTKDWPSKGAAVEPVPDVPPPVEEPATSVEATASSAGEGIVGLEPAQVLAETPPEAAGQPTPTEKAGLAVLVLDRSVEDPFSGNVQNVCARLQDHANDLLKQIGSLPDGALDVGIISYGLDASGQVEVRVGFEGPLANRPTVPRADLATGALRVDEFEEEMSNGMGGLVKVRRKKPIYFDVEPTAGAPASEAFAAVAQMVAAWLVAHPVACLPPVILHLSRGRSDASGIEQAICQIRSIQTVAGPVVLYHLVATEQPQKSLAYPETSDDIGDPSLQKLWELSSPLLGRERLSAEKPTVTTGSRGIVINGKFDLFLDEIKQTLTQ